MGSEGPSLIKIKNQLKEFLITRIKSPYFYKIVFNATVSVIFGSFK